MYLFVFWYCKGPLASSLHLTAVSLPPGMTLGTLVTMPFSGLLAATLGWESVFYVQGALSIIWYILWLIFVYDSPSQHPRISRAERQMIETSMGVSTTAPVSMAVGEQESQSHCSMGTRHARGTATYMWYWKGLVMLADCFVVTMSNI